MVQVGAVLSPMSIVFQPKVISDSLIRLVRKSFVAIEELKAVFLCQVPDEALVDHVSLLMVALDCRFPHWDR